MSVADTSMSTSSARTAAAAVAAEVVTSVSLAPLALGLAAATGQLYLDDALGQEVVDVRFGVDRSLSQISAAVRPSSALAGSIILPL